MNTDKYKPIKSRKNTKLTTTEKDRVFELYVNGYTYKDIANIMGRELNPNSNSNGNRTISSNNIKGVLERRLRNIGIYQGKEAKKAITDIVKLNKRKLKNEKLAEKRKKKLLDESKKLLDNNKKLDEETAKLINNVNQVLRNTTVVVKGGTISEIPNTDNRLNTDNREPVYDKTIRHHRIKAKKRRRKRKSDNRPNNIEPDNSTEYGVIIKEYTQGSDISDSELSKSIAELSESYSVYSEEDED